jgi:folate-binding protein YgfZ
MNSSSQATAPNDAGAERGINAPSRPSADAFAALHAEHGVYAVLDQFGVIDVHGDDAARFLHGQLTHDVQTLEAGNARLAGFCSPKGRLLATLLLWRTADAVRMLVSADLVAPVQKRLSMFVLRAKARLSDASQDLAIVGFAGDVRAALSRCFDALPDGVHVKLDAACGDAASGELIRVPDAHGMSRFLWVGPKAAVGAKLAALETTHGMRRVDPALWDWLDIQAGEPRVSAATSEQFVPQMINFELIGGVNFRKGCYPGQEVVTRLQYRGTLKRRAMLAHAAQAHVGAQLFHSADPDQPCGMVVNAAAAPGGGVDCLVEVKLGALETGSVHVESANGPALTFLPLPYPLPATPER